MLQSDSISTSVAGEEQVVHKHYQPTPAQIISWLPKGATPAQQDSLVQKYIKPSEITWSTRLDTLHLPGHAKGKSILDATVPQYYKESYFSNKPYFHPEIEGGRQGVAGDPVPYTIAGDNFMSSLLLICLVAATISFQNSRNFIARQFKSLFYMSRAAKEVTETSSEVRFQFILTAEACLLFAIAYFFYLRTQINTFTIEQYTIIFLFSGVFAAHFFVKYILYSMVNWVFFDRKNNQQWVKSMLFFSSLEGLLMLPIIFVQSFFDLSINTTLIYAVFVIVLFKLLTFYKGRQIFFSQNGLFFQNILYFCALEIIPLTVLGYILMITSEILKINF